MALAEQTNMKHIIVNGDYLDDPSTLDDNNSPDGIQYWHWLNEKKRHTAILQRSNILFIFEWGFDERGHVLIEEQETQGNGNIATVKGTTTCEVSEGRDIWRKLKQEGFMRRLP